jgi:hypothetical protein
MRKLALVSAAVAAVLFAAPAQATITPTGPPITFDEFVVVGSSPVTNWYPGIVTFTSSPGEEVTALADDLGSSLPNFICSAPVGGVADCTHDVYADFAGPVSGLTFLQVGDNASGDIGDVRVFAGGTLLGTVDIIGDNDFSVANLVDLTAFSGVTRIEISNTDPGGLGFDDFNFVFDQVVAAVPEPSSWAMMLLGFAAIGVAMRGRRISGVGARTA